MNNSSRGEGSSSIATFSTPPQIVVSQDRSSFQLISFLEQRGFPLPLTRPLAVEKRKLNVISRANILYISRSYNADFNIPLTPNVLFSARLFGQRCIIRMRCLNFDVAFPAKEII